MAPTHGALSALITLLQGETFAPDRHASLHCRAPSREDEKAHRSLPFPAVAGEQPTGIWAHGGPICGMYGATGNIYVGLHEFADMGFFLHFLRPDDLFLDVGSNVGSYTVLAAKGVGASCIAIEPVDTTFERLMDNVRMNRIEDRVDARRAAIGGASGVVRFSTDEDTMNRVVDEQYAGTSVQVPVHTLDEIVADRRPIAVKIDVEGFERAVLDGACRMLADTTLQAIIMETDETIVIHGATAREVLMAAGFTEHRYDVMRRALSPVMPTRGARSPHGNYLFLRDAAFAQARVSSAPRYDLGPWQV